MIQIVFRLPVVVHAPEMDAFPVVCVAGGKLLHGFMAPTMRAFNAILAHRGGIYLRASDNTNLANLGKFFHGCALQFKQIYCAF